MPGDRASRNGFSVHDQRRFLQERGDAPEGAVRLLREDVGDEDLDLLGTAVPGVPHAKVEVVRVGGDARRRWVRDEGVVKVGRLGVDLEPELGADKETGNPALECGDRG